MKDSILLNISVLLILSIALLFALSACEQDEMKNALAGGENPLLYPMLMTSATQAPSENVEFSNADDVEVALFAYKEVIQNNANFYNVIDHETVNLSRFVNEWEKDQDFHLKFIYFTVVDLDDDKVPEVVLGEVICNNINGTHLNYYGYLILHYDDNIVYGYELGARSLMCLKVDGTFEASDGAGDQGTHIITFEQDAYTLDPITYCATHGIYNPKGEGTIYFVNRKGATEAEYDLAMDEQCKKEDTPWHSFTDENIDIVFSAYLEDLHP